jgi:GalNAc-alpha-(1->4)-GalNAc-alpha-(1->3)-diNAcBac-PP-undecaprenol alpha-1,4-N-acetyl-D-galactosaminyltransferase
VNLLRSDSDRRSIVLVIGGLQGGGAERQISDMANFWAAREWQVTLATWSALLQPDFYALDSLVSRVSLASAGEDIGRVSRLGVNLRRIARLRRLLGRVRPAAVISFMTQSNVLTILAGMGLACHIAVSERVQPQLHPSLPRSWYVLRRMLYARAGAVVAQTEDAACWLRIHCQTPVTVIPNALREMPEASSVRQSTVVAIGRLTYQKGFDVLLRAFSLQASDFPEWRVVIIGEGEERAALTRLKRELGLEGRVEFVGQQPDVVPWLCEAGLVVQPSRFEGFPNVVLEAMGLGAAVISADCSSGPADMIEDGVNGRLTPVDDVEGLAAVMRELMGSPAERARLGVAAVGVRERFSQARIMSLWERTFFAAPGGAGDAGYLKGAQ